VLSRTDQLIAINQLVHSIIQVRLAWWLLPAAGEALRLGNALLNGIAERTRHIFGLRAPQTDEISRLDYQMVTCRGDTLQPPE